eukprot:TRINITY_DN3932_c0_g1_i1.p1 TRINITY_DN3932_c0_g1~~TRINITY_DN3932_c0_g1_i1.p1  ORF type:complete len:179 (+),score=26.06 TRINITY_DN3932_c0_g1_i1:99-635(+)
MRPEKFSSEEVKSDPKSFLINDPEHQISLIKSTPKEDLPALLAGLNTCLTNFEYNKFVLRKSPAKSDVLIELVSMLLDLPEEDYFLSVFNGVYSLIEQLLQPLPAEAKHYEFIYQAISSRLPKDLIKDSSHTFMVCARLLYLFVKTQASYKGREVLSLIHICRCRRYAVCRSRWSPYH